MLALSAAPLAVDASLTTLALHLLAPQPAPRTKPAGTPVSRLFKWRAEHPALFEKRRIEGLKRSARVREHLQRLHCERKAEWRASALKNPKLRATDQHIAAKEWRLRAPDGSIHQIRNLKKFIRDNPSLFHDADVEWKEVPGRPNQTWCRAFHALSRLRPNSSRPLHEWEGWRWAWLNA